MIMADHEPSKKRKLYFNEQTCCFCKKNFNQNKVTLNPAKCDSLLNACKNKTDEISTNIVSIEEKIRSGHL